MREGGGGEGRGGKLVVSEGGRKGVKKWNSQQEETTIEVCPAKVK